MTALVLACKAFALIVQASSGAFSDEADVRRTRHALRVRQTS